MRSKNDYKISIVILLVPLEAWRKKQRTSRKDYQNILYGRGTCHTVVHNLPFQHPQFLKCQSIEYLVTSYSNSIASYSNNEVCFN